MVSVLVDVVKDISSQGQEGLLDELINIVERGRLLGV
jgi:hypothetical protein